MSEKSKTEQENQRVIKAETIPDEGILLGHHELVYVASDFSDEITLFLGPRRQPEKFSRIVTIRLGNEEVHDDIEILAVPTGDATYDDATFFAYAIDPKRPDQIPVPFFNIIEHGPGVIGRKSKPERDYKPTVAPEHVRVFSEGVLLGIENLEPHYSTTLIGNQPLGQQNLPDLIA